MSADLFNSITASMPTTTLKRDRRKTSLIYIVLFYARFYTATVDRAEIAMLVMTSIVSYVFSYWIATAIIIVLLSSSSSIAPVGDIRFLRVVVIWTVAQTIRSMIFLFMRCLVIVSVCFVTIPIFKAAISGYHHQPKESFKRKPGRSKDCHLKSIEFYADEIPKVDRDTLHITI